jgi:hypothetical protein
MASARSQPPGLTRVAAPGKLTDLGQFIFACTVNDKLTHLSVQQAADYQGVSLNALNAQRAQCVTAAAGLRQSGAARPTGARPRGRITAGSAPREPSSPRLSASRHTCGIPARTM